MSIQCIVSGCSSTDVSKSMFGFPKHDLNLLELWFNEIPNLDVNHLDLDVSCICEDHFKPEEIISSFSYFKDLVDEAVPSRFNCLENINLNACRFCLQVKNYAERIKVDENIKRNFKNLMGTDLRDDSYLPNTVCSTCCNILKSTAQAKLKIEKSQNLLLELFERKVQIQIKQEIEDEEDQIIISNIEIKKENILEFSSDPLVSNKTLATVPSKSRKSKTSSSRTSKKTKVKKEAAKIKLKIKKSNRAQCPHCYETVLKKDMAKHKRDFHKNFYKCDYCSKRFAVKDSLKKHLEKHHSSADISGKYEPCEECGKPLVRNYVRRHMKECHPEKLATLKLEKKEGIKNDYRRARTNCNICHKTFQKREILSHKIKYHNLQPDFLCDICGVGRYQKSRLAYHIRTTHLLEKIKFKCPHCQEEFANKNDWKDHNFKNHFSLMEVCEFCGLTCINTKGYIYHKKSMHNSEEPYKCKEYKCDKKFSNKEDLNNHKNLAHTTCMHCSKVFPTPRALQTHLKLAHLEKPYVCTAVGCGKRFGLINLLKTHSLMHSSEKTFQCKFCNHSYYKHIDLSRHIKASHMNIKIPCEVPGCKSSFPRKDSLRYHVIHQHKDLDPAYIETILETIRDIKLPKTKDFLKQHSN